MPEKPDPYYTTLSLLFYYRSGMELSINFYNQRNVHNPVAKPALVLYRYAMQTYLLTEQEKDLARRIQGDIPVESRPFHTIGKAVGLNEGEVIAAINRLKHLGIIRKFAAIVRHQRVGYEKNAMVVWAVPEAACEKTGQFLATFKEITHCYARVPPFEGRYNLFTMIHFRKENPEEFVQRLATLSGIGDYKILLSEEEFKKSSMAYF
jgi:siroheme decarboxylase